MTTKSTAQPQRIRDRLAGHHILVTGATGFLARAFVEKMLRSVDSIGGIHLLVRSRSGRSSAARRVERDVLGSSAFNRLRASLGHGFDRLCEEKIHVVAGDLTQVRMGLTEDAYRALTEKITLVVNSAATVTFDERLDLAVDLNTLGPPRLLRFARDCGDVPFMHVSTCYVCGARSGRIVEDMTAPQSARESLPRLGENGAFDLDALVELLQAQAEEICTRLGPETEACRRELIDAGMRFARANGWHDTYTFTKWIGEQLIARDRGNVPLVIFRPAIIEGSYEEPAPGWIDGLRMADPIIVAYGRGQLKEFPARRGALLDFIPVDLVVNAMMAGLEVEPNRDRLTIYQCASSDRNPLTTTEVATSLEEAYRRRPMMDERGRPIRPGPLRIEERESFIRRWQRRLRRVNRLRDWLTRFNKNSKRARRLSATARQIDQVIYFAKIYSPYTHFEGRFADDGLLRLAEQMHPTDREEFKFDVARIDWRDYLVNRHVPGLRAYVLRSGSEPTRRILAADPGRAAEPGGESLEGRDLFDVFQRSARRFPEKPAFQVRRQGRWIRYSYDEALQGTGAIMRRFVERGLVPGDRVAICGDNCPEWALTYLAAMRAGLTAIPLDPQLRSSEAWSAARFAAAKLMCATRSTLDGLKKARESGDVELVEMAEPFVPPPGASRDAAPDPIAMDGGEVASILFTSGTTVAAKAVQLTHRNLIANASALVNVHRIYPTDEFLSVLPMYHAFEFTGGLLVPIACAATITYVDQLKGSELTSAMQSTGTTVMLVVPRLLRLLHDGISSKVAEANWFVRTLFRSLGVASDLTGRRFAKLLFGKVHRQFGGRLRMFVSGGSRLDPALYDAFQRMGFPVCEGYGLTETSPVISINPLGACRAGSVGRPLENVETEIRNQDADAVGELWVRGPSVTQGYLDNPAATEELLVEGWLRTGDLGRRDADGYLFLTGRSKDLIVTAAGKNVYPDEVEFRYKDLPFTKELCVFAMPSTKGHGDAVHAVIVLDSDSAPDRDRSSIEREIRLAAETIAEELPSHQRIAALHFWEKELPKTSTLKAKRGLIRDMVLGEQARRAGGGEDDPGRATEGSRSLDELAKHPAMAVVRNILASKTGKPERAIAPAHHLLLDLGVDSIGKIDLIGAIEAAYDMRLDDEAAAAIVRVADLVRVIGDRTLQKGAKRDQNRWRRRVVDTADRPPANGRLPAPLVPLRWVVRGGVGAFMHSYVRVRAFGRENLPQTGAFILAPNHASHLDSPSVLTAVGKARRVWVAGAEDYFFNTGIKRFLFGKVFDTIAFDRHADGLAGLRRCGEALSRGDGLLIFPEGTRSISGALQPFKIGVAVLAVERGVPIVPVHVDRAYELFRKGHRIVRPGVVTVRFAPPIHPPEIDADADHYAVFRELTARVQEAVAGLAGVV
ncbi:MAG: AMP-binding protein [Planctomycetes bacterium]|nr:AMP-binding protein [Planctomycetota bacterium]